MRRSRGDAFAAYCRRVNAFFPWPLRIDAAKPESLVMSLIEALSKAAERAPLPDLAAR